MRTTLASLCLAAGILGIVVAGSGQARAADKRFECRMKGQWGDAVGDIFEFDAVYMAKDGGADIFAGIYDNPGAGSKADVKGVASKGTWLILLTYTDAGHKGMVKELKGTGSKDSATQQLTVAGNYRTLLAGKDIAKNGTFKLLGKCR